VQRKVSSFSSPGSLLYSDSIQLERVDRWNSYWTEDKQKTFFENFDKAATQTGFKTASFSDFFNLIRKQYSLIDSNDFKRLQNHFYADNIITTPSLSTIVSVIKVDDFNKEMVENEVSKLDGVVVMDRKSFYPAMVKALGNDFNLIANISLSLILVILILAFGRFELGFITFVPILLSWLWTLGIMGMAGIKFNIFNIIISSFITGLGIDYSIYIMQGLVQGYKSNNKNLLSYKTCILISVMISISGTGVLILAKHPSLNSIAVISIIGLLSVVLISYTFEPILFYWLVSKKGKNRKSPITISDFLINVIALAFGLLENLFMHVLLLLIILLPIRSKTKRHLLHGGLVWSLRFMTLVPIYMKKKTINVGHEDFKTPSLIISNHQSHLDLPFILKISPNIIVLTAKWVWNNPIYAPVVRYLDYYRCS